MSSVRLLLIAGAMALLVAIAPLPNEYYKALRFFICGICIFTAYVSLREQSLLAFPFLLAGIIFNPIVKVQMDREIWIFADLLVALGFLATVRLAPRLDAAKVVTIPVSTEGTPETQPVQLSS